VQLKEALQEKEKLTTELQQTKDERDKSNNDLALANYTIKDKDAEIKRLHDVYNHDQDNDPTLHLKERDDKIQQQQKEIDLLTSELNKKEI